jgi:hypothetical protein
MRPKQRMVSLRPTLSLEHEPAARPPPVGFALFRLRDREVNRVKSGVAAERQIECAPAVKREAVRGQNAANSASVILGLSFVLIH